MWSPVRAFSPLIDVRVNLGHEKPLDSRTVLLNTATLLYQKLKRQPRETTIARWVTGFGTAGLFAWAVGGSLWTQVNGWLHTWLPPVDVAAAIAPWLAPNWIGVVVTFMLTRYVWTRHLPTYDRVLFRMKQLHGRMAFANEYTRAIGDSGFMLSRRKKRRPDQCPRNRNGTARYSR